jgi:peptide alpha-N-acetyltransferase
MDQLSTRKYSSDEEMPEIMALLERDLSEPYSIFTYRYFIHRCPELTLLTRNESGKLIAVIICKLDPHRSTLKRGYIGMLAVETEYRNKGLGSMLVVKAIQKMIELDADEVVLETELTNKGALNLYERLGFVRDKKLTRYYLNGVDAYRLKLLLK